MKVASSVLLLLVTLGQLWGTVLSTATVENDSGLLSRQLQLHQFEMNNPGIVQRERELAWAEEARGTKPKLSVDVLSETYFEDEIWDNEVSWPAYQRTSAANVTSEWRKRKQMTGTVGWRRLAAKDYLGRMREKARATASVEEGVLHVTFVSGDYGYLGLNWLASLHRLGLRNALVVALDNKAGQILKEKGIEFFQGDPRMVEGLSGERFASMWQVRWVHAIELLTQGITVVMSDSDVVWLRPPALNLDVADIWASTGSYPQGFFDRWGFTVCNGLLVLRGSPRVASFAHLVLDNIGLTGDDQVSLNLELERSKLQELTAHLPQFAARYFYTLAPVLRVAIVDGDYISRSCVRQESMAAIHCLSPKSFEAKHKELSKHQLWLLDEKFDPLP